VFHQVELDKVTVREKMTLLLDKLRAEGRVFFDELFNDAKTRMDVVVMFLAMLELVKVCAIRIFQEQVTGPIVIEAAAGMEQAAEVAIAEESKEEQHGT
jgi:segregation and condensation protein A